MKHRLTISFGEVADREKRHPSEGVSGHLGASGKEASEIRGARVPGRKVARVFMDRLTLGSGPVGAMLGRKFSRTFLGRLTLRLSPVGAIGLGRLAREPSPDPWYPQQGHLMYKFRTMCCFIIILVVQQTSKVNFRLMFLLLIFWKEMHDFYK